MGAPVEARDAAPGSSDAGNVEDVLHFLEAHRSGRGLYLVSEDGEDRVRLGGDLPDVFVRAVQATGAEVTTQQAADLLGLSRPTVVKLIETGELPATVPGTVRRKLKLADVLRYRDDMRVRRNAFLDELSEAYPDTDLPAEEMTALLDEARARPGRTVAPWTAPPR